jgi:hypothetical protein
MPQEHPKPNWSSIFKKLGKLINLVVMISCLHACNNPESKNDESTLQDSSGVAKRDLSWVNDFKARGCELAGGMGNFVVDKTLADSMIHHFDTIYKVDDTHTDIPAFRDTYWIDACTISAVADFLRNSHNHDGVRIYFGCGLEDDPGYGTDPIKRKSTIFIYPTTKRIPSRANKSDHLDGDPSQISIGNCAPSDYIKPPHLSVPEIEQFNIVYRKSSGPAARQKDSLSRSIWLDSCVIYFIDEAIKANSNVVDGINVKGAAYFKNFPKPIRGKFKPNQSTLIIALSNNDNTHSDNWDIIEEVKNKFFRGGGLNHGELCPDDCP